METDPSEAQFNTLWGQRNKALRGSDFWSVVSLEFLLVQRNGGLVILLRAFVIAGGSFLLATFLQTQMLDTSLTVSAIGEKLPWFGAIFLAVYLALYARFASQWSYLCSVYNQIQQTEVTTPGLTDDQRAALVTWKVGFIVDAWCHHLLAKPPFAGTIARWLIEDDALLERYIKLNGKPDAEQVVDFLAAGLGDGDDWVTQLRDRLKPL